MTAATDAWSGASMNCRTVNSNVAPPTCRRSVLVTDAWSSDNATVAAAPSGRRAGSPVSTS
ncbi:hypothetical protein [Burkholderia sp. ABCPW 14]|uniref:hypothetical protein n=1 Tax=Burkholderia sp. ABCPW 14 TaxID=1637860 RepID=UPI0018D26A7C|nr:hypothetical protein [Burkholderia sp. ABCPW 14]